MWDNPIIGSHASFRNFGKAAIGCDWLEWQGIAQKLASKDLIIY